MVAYSIAFAVAVVFRFPGVSQQVAALEMTVWYFRPSKADLAETSRGLRGTRFHVPVPNKEIPGY